MYVYLLDSFNLSLTGSGNMQCHKSLRLLTILALLSAGTATDNWPISDRCAGGTVPIPIFNSRYRILEDQHLCCPERVYDVVTAESYCLTEDRVREFCAREGRGMVYEPCYHCRTCAKKVGETCGGLELIHGECDQGLLCAGIEENEERIGMCIPVSGPETKEVGMECGGRLDSLGVCASELWCSKEEGSESGVCGMNYPFPQNTETLQKLIIN